MKYTVLDYLEETAEKFPNKTAFADMNSSVTWMDFVTESKRLSSVIKKYFLPGAAVPVMAEKSVLVLEFFFAALYAGCFYSCIESSFPDSRIKSMLEPLNADYIIADSRF